MTYGGSVRCARACHLPYAHTALCQHSYVRALPPLKCTHYCTALQTWHDLQRLKELNGKRRRSHKRPREHGPSSADSSRFHYSTAHSLLNCRHALLLHCAACGTVRYS